MVTLTPKQLAKVVEESTQSRKIGLSYRKPLDMYKKGNPYYGRVEVIQNIRGHINANYTKRKQAEDPNHVTKPRAWGSRVGNSPLIEHQGFYYIEVKCEGRVDKARYFLDGIEITDPKIIEECLKHKKPSKTDESLRCFKLENLTRLRLNGETYHTKKG